MSTTPAPTFGPGINLLTTSTPNGIKVSVALEELQLVGAIPGYNFTKISFQANDQKSDWFMKVNPNGVYFRAPPRLHGPTGSLTSLLLYAGRIPALVDNREGKKPINVWESASILLYLSKTYDTKFAFHFEDEDEETEMINWIMFLQGGVGPMQGQGKLWKFALVLAPTITLISALPANHFNRYAPEKIQYGIDRYQNETRRLYGVYEQQLAGGKEYLVGPGKGKYSYADMCSFPWIRSHDWAGVSTEKFPNVEAWIQRNEARPGVIAGLKIPEQDGLTLMKLDPELAAKTAKEGSAWVSCGGSEDWEAGADVIMGVRQIMKGVANDAKK
ncbi:glutathione S-transferase, partial [Phenoliferia sp. Uapishka_3]